MLIFVILIRHMNTKLLKSYSGSFLSHERKTRAVCVCVWGGGGGGTPCIRMIGMIVVFLGVLKAKSFKRIKLVFVRV